VVVERTRDPAVLAGDNTRAPRLVYLPQNAQVVPGDRIVTSGHGGVFPPGLAVGMVTTITDGAIRITPFVDWERLEYVRLLMTGTDGVVLPESANLPPFSVMGSTAAPRTAGTRQ
jgi:rod shape-determining protein MreC